MLRAAESDLLDFCARQRTEFDPVDWHPHTDPERQRLALVARLLAGTRWYGHRDRLFRVAAELDPKGADEVVARIQALDFDCPRFVQMLEARLTHEA